MKHWYEKQPELMIKVESEIEAQFPALRVLKISGLVVIRGRLDIMQGDSCVDGYGIEVILGDDHPRSIPKVFETDKRVPRIIDRHINEDGSACLFVNWERHKYWTDPTCIGSFLRGPVNSFFYSQTYFAKYNEWPWGDRPHGLPGIIDSLEDELGFKGRNSVVAALKMLTSEKVSGHLACPCGSNQILRKCHGQNLVTLHKIIGAREAKHVLGVIRWYEHKQTERDRAAMRRLLQHSGTFR